MAEYIGFVLTFFLALAVAGLMLGLQAVLGPRKPNPVKAEPFECGVMPFGLPHGNFSVKFYLVAMLFILFDVEIVWFFPWAVVLKTLGWTALVEMFFFAAVLVLGFAYAWKKGALEWER